MSNDETLIYVQVS